MLAKDPKERITAKELLIHPFITSGIIKDNLLTQHQILKISDEDIKESFKFFMKTKHAVRNLIIKHIANDIKYIFIPILQTI